jgi:hypothetical protein
MLVGSGDTSKQPNPIAARRRSRNHFEPWHHYFENTHRFFSASTEIAAETEPGASLSQTAPSVVNIFSPRIAD